MLLAEDEDDVRSMVHEALEQRGYNVLEARDGAEALMICKRHHGPIHLLVTDVMMPNLGGCELADRAHVVRPDMRVLFVSGHSRDMVVRDGKRVVEDAFLAKLDTAAATN